MLIMKAVTTAEQLGLECLVSATPERDLSTGYTSDLLSDVMAHAQDDCALITIQSHKNTVAVSTLVGASMIIICNSRNIPDDMIQSCKEEEVGLYRTADSQFQVSGKLYQLLNNS
jgi:hypothetical protein